VKVLVAETIADSGIEKLRAEGHDVDIRTDLTPEQLLDAIESYDAIIVRSATKVTADVLDRARSLKVVGRAGVGVDNVDVDAATRHGVLVVNAPTSNNVSAAEHTMALLLAQARNIAQANASLKAGKWERSKFEGVELYGKTLAVLGLGRIGTLVAQRALAFGMKIVAFDPYVSKQRAGQMGVELVPTIEDALRQADFVTVHLPKTKETAALIGDEALALCKKGARILNVARGGIVDEAALARAVASGHLGGAGIDVFETEPTTSSPMFEQDSIVVTPHLGASTTEAQDKAGITIAEQVAAALRGDMVQYAVNVDVGREIAESVRPFLALAEKLGRIFTNISEGAHRVRFSFDGQIAEHDTRVLTLSALKGMLSAVVHEPVTFVNAPLMAEERGIEYTEEKTPTGRAYLNEIEISSDGLGVSGTVVGKRNEERITGVYDFKLEMAPGRYMCFLRYDDRPGVIGAIGTILGEHKINIADMHVGRRERGGEALMALSVDHPMSAEVLTALAKGSGAKDAKFIVLGE
jgi:D-3-phosphoglycerate dehydrogenase